MAQILSPYDDHVYLIAFCLYFSYVYIYVSSHSHTAILRTYITNLSVVLLMQAEAALKAITESCEAKKNDQKSANLLELAVNAARARCSVGEITSAMEQVSRAIELGSTNISG